MSKRLIGAAVAAAAVLISLVPAGSAATTGRTAVVAVDSDPLCLNALLGDCGTVVTATATAPVLAGAFRVRPDFTFEPVLVERVDVQAQPFELTYHIRPDAVWSDGAPVTAADFRFTLETILDPANNTLRAGYEHVVDAVELGPKTLRVRFSAPNPDWRLLFRHVLPKHVLEGHDFDTVFRERIADPATGVPIGSGPFLVADWTRGVAITLVRNPRWWGRPQFLETIELAIVPDANTKLNGIRSGALDLIFPLAQFGIADLRTTAGVVVEHGTGTAMEHIDFNVGSATMPLLRERWFRQAVAHALDRQAVANSLYDQLVSTYPALHNLSLSNVQPAYDPVFARYAGDSAAVAALMGDHGCARGADGIWVCGGIRASVKLATTTGNQQRALVQQQLIGQAGAAGIELVPDNSSAGVLFGSRLGARDYEAIMFAWVRSAAMPSLTSLYGCGGQQNFMNYCSPALDALALAAETELDPAERARLANDANRVLAEDMPSLPLFMRIAFLARREALRGPQLNAAGFGTWNTEEWRFGDDLAAPTTTVTAAPSANAAGWNDGPVTVTLAAADDDSGVKEIRYTLAGAQAGGAVLAAGGSQVTISAEGITTLEYFSTDWSGNAEAAKTLTIRIDRTAPAVTCAADPATLWPPTRRLVPVQTSVDVSDALSGPAGFTLVSVAGGGAGDVAGFDPGSADTSGSLRAELDRGRERSYELVYVGADRAGNTSRCTVAVRVGR